MFGGFTDHDAFGANWNLDEIQQLEDITAGGFLEDDAVAASEEGGQHGERVSPSKQSMMPAKIGMIVSAWKEETSYIQFFNKIPDVIKIVGRIEQHTSTEDSTQFVIDDGTGRIQCMYSHPSDMTPFRQRELEKLRSTTKMVAVYGSYNPIYSANCPTLIIFKIREVYCSDEFTLHELDIIHMILRNEREGMPLKSFEVSSMMRKYDQAPGMASGASPGASHAMASSMAGGMPHDFAPSAVPGVVHAVSAGYTPGGSPNFTSSMTPGMTPGSQPLLPPSGAPAEGQGPLTLIKYVAHLLASEMRNGNLNGLHVSEITRQCKMQRNFQSISEQHVRKVLAELEKDATVYQTVDAHTFASTDA
ncbi:RP-A, OB fold single strand binding protein [Babesia caballi]|uniref:RP-A, OB fold single strand binding protein n=1 Tax=Babesia caballi TaxID=5871 RepID=A0AAV4LUE4_BABCB|nr:RP-A, OB fold single strand binding protein [Babesia caballi]